MDKTKPITIKIVKPESKDINIGTCRSYDEQIPIPSFIRQLSVTVNETPRKKNATKMN